MTKRVNLLATWHAVYAIILVLGAMMFFWCHDECVGPEVGYYLLVLGVIPNLALLLVAFYRPTQARKWAMGYGLFIALAMLAVTVTANTFMWLIIGAPLAGFPVEALVLRCLSGPR